MHPIDIVIQLAIAILSLVSALVALASAVIGRSARRRHEVKCGHRRSTGGRTCPGPRRLEHWSVDGTRPTARR